MVRNIIFLCDMFVIAVGFSVPMAPGSEFRSVYQRQEDGQETQHSVDGANPTNPYGYSNNAANSIPPPQLPGKHPDLPPAYEATAPTSNPTNNDSLNIPMAPTSNPNAEKDSSPSAPTYDDLAARFAALRNNNQK